MASKAAKILLIGSALWYLGEGMLGPLFAVFAQRIGGDILEISWAWAIYLFVVGILTIIFGKFSDKWNMEKMMIFGYGLNAIFTFGYLLVSSPVQLFFVQAGIGLASALAIPTWNALYSKHLDRKREGAAWGIAGGMPNIVTGIAIVIGGIIVTYFSFAALFITMGIIQIIAAVYQAEILRHSRKK